MRLSKLAMLFAAMGWLFTSPALAQTGSRMQVRRTPAVAPRPIGYEYNDIQPPADPEASPSDPAPSSYYNGAAANGKSCCKPEPTCEAEEPTCEAEEPSCEEKPKCKDCCDWCDLGEPCELFGDCCCLKRKNIVIKGWLDQGYTWNPANPVDKFNGVQTFNDRANEYQMNQLYLYAERATDTECHPLDWGFRVDALYGTDWRTTPALGMEFNIDGTRNWNTDHRFYGLALPQLYAQFALNDLSIKAGKFYTPIGYEVVTATGNFFYSHAYTHQYGEPFTHTGMLATYKISDNWTVLGGFNRGWDQWEDVNSDLSGMWGAAWTSSDGNTSFAYAANYGNEAANKLGVVGEQNRYVHSLIFTRKCNDKLTYVAHSDYGNQEDAIGGTNSAEWYSVTQYLIYKVNDCLSYGLRYEWMRDDDGFRIFGFGSGVEPTIGYQGGGYAGNFQDITLGINYKRTANLTLRPEVRWDWYDGLDSTNVNANGVTLARPWDFGTSNSQFTFGIDAIYTY